VGRFFETHCSIVVDGELW